VIEQADGDFFNLATPKLQAVVIYENNFAVLPKLRFMSRELACIFRRLSVRSLSNGRDVYTLAERRALRQAPNLGWRVPFEQAGEIARKMSDAATQ